MNACYQGAPAWEVGGEIAAAIEDGEIETTQSCSGPMIDIHELAELAEQAVHVWPIDMT